ncbi:alpha/beta fold hydrolase [Halomontanus rarus]|uniref:alpha/beta fold hydrolase n=1 Tax=Halomontanus rarus TaxID=3034020 RepID=UPI00293C0A1A|nr:alpha/beta fold hydrolase [Halovivax sp. KZCA124]
MGEATPPDTDGELDVHRIVSADGTEIAGRMHGQGPPLVLVHGGLGDGETSWESLLPFLADRFTCYTMSARGWGLSSQHSDHSPERLVEEELIDLVGNDDEVAGLSATDYFEAAGQHVPVHLQELEQATQSDDPGPTDPSVLARITVPVLLLHGSRTTMDGWFTDSVRYVADHVADPHVREIADAGHLGPYCEPDAVADELLQFFERALQPA